MDTTAPIRPINNIKDKSPLFPWSSVRNLGNILSVVKFAPNVKTPANKAVVFSTIWSNPISPSDNNFGRINAVPMKPTTIPK